MTDLPWTDPQTIEACQRRLESYAEKERRGETVSLEELTSAQFQLAWALAHSPTPADVSLAIRMLKDLKDPRKESMRDYHYILAVAKFRSGDHFGCRSSANDALKVAPSCRQSAALRDAAVEAIARDGLIGLGVIASGAVVVVGSIIASMAKKR
mmetsp:Transcript_37773/g.52451  ORF Transcript_37773/g.52451 Transcript_37773/m.52451 type:complete len:154 (+) Transcript_37773:64-525(+)|eukprot:CAMPEP_0196577134 /NCGR_PEP_ID=MMETSP1081-20130531/6253_1 /TAXON_ID=36882 /ORGANISM="Pyramimonas amylifera, Strain CCMP720" /LENGTH=153 /DNA_ID=CAMNT_0041895961 /DNA_START=1 /DNA_END=462 /DNA_ORIENTATION=+